MTGEQVPLGSPRGRWALQRLLGDPALAASLVAAYPTWAALAHAEPGDRWRRVGHWAASLVLPAACPPLPPVPPGTWVRLRDEAAYPHRLADDPGAPLVLWGQGTLGTGPHVAVAGSRRPSPVALQDARRSVDVILAGSLATPVALLDDGVGSVVVRHCLARRAPVVAVTAADAVASPDLAALSAAVLAAGGAVISADGPDPGPGATTRAARLTVALANAVVLVEVGPHPDAGASVVRAAIDLDRPVVVPGVDAPSSRLLAAARASLLGDGTLVRRLVGASGDGPITGPGEADLATVLPGLLARH